eukprot:6207062-Pleurochrysis_carterae.AAC.1
MLERSSSRFLFCTPSSRFRQHIRNNTEQQRSLKDLVEKDAKGERCRSTCWQTLISSGRGRDRGAPSVMGIGEGAIIPLGTRCMVA